MTEEKTNPTDEKANTTEDGKEVEELLGLVKKDTRPPEWVVQLRKLASQDVRDNSFNWYALEDFIVKINLLKTLAEETGVYWSDPKLKSNSSTISLIWERKPENEITLHLEVRTRGGCQYNCLFNSVSQKGKGMLNRDAFTMLDLFDVYKEVFDLSEQRKESDKKKKELEKSLIQIPYTDAGQAVSLNPMKWEGGGYEVCLMFMPEMEGKISYALAAKIDPELDSELLFFRTHSREMVKRVIRETIEIQHETHSSGEQLRILFAAPYLEPETLDTKIKKHTHSTSWLESEAQSLASDIQKMKKNPVQVIVGEDNGEEETKNTLTVG